MESIELVVLLIWCCLFSCVETLMIVNKNQRRIKQKLLKEKEDELYVKTTPGSYKTIKYIKPRYYGPPRSSIMQ